MAAKAAGAAHGMMGADVAHNGTIASRWKLSPSKALTTVMFSIMIVALMLWRNGKERMEFVAMEGPRANVTCSGRPWSYGVLNVMSALIKKGPCYQLCQC